MIYLCEVVAQGVRSFGSTLCTRSYLAEAVDFFPLEGFNHMTNIGVLIYDIFVWSGCSRFLVFWEYPMYPNMVSERLWRAASVRYQDLEPVLPKLWKGFRFWIFCTFVACGSCSIASGASFSLENSFCFIENYLLWKMNPSDRTIALTKLLVKDANLHTKEIEIGATLIYIE